MATKQQEAEEALKKSQELLEKEVETPEETPTEEPEPEESPTPSEDEPEEDVEAEVEDEDEDESEPEPEPSKENVDYKKKFSESSRESQKLYAKTRKLNQAIDEANDIPEPTEDELAVEYPEWDVMTDTEKRLARESVVSKRFRERISQAREEAKRIEKWSDEVDAFADDPKLLIDHPQLEGKLEEFKTFANQESHNSVPFNLLVTSFLYNQGIGKTKHKGKMMETGTAGPNDRAKPKGDMISLEEAEKLRKANYAKYKELLMAGKIQMTL